MSLLVSYTLDELNQVQPERDLMRWAAWYESHRGTRCGVALTKLDGDVVVSTVFLGVDHNFGAGPPLVFETMIFGGPHHLDGQRYSSWIEAEQGHEEMIAYARGQTPHPRVLARERAHLEDTQRDG